MLRSHKTTRIIASSFQSLLGLGWLLTACAFITMLSVYLLWAWATFGTSSSALAYLSGRRLLVDAPSRSVGTLVEGQTRRIQFVIMNYTDHPIELVGAGSSCTCTMAEDLPLTIPVSGRRPITVAVKAGTKQGKFSESVAVFTDDRNHPSMYLKIKGYVSPGHGEGPRGEE